MQVVILNINKSKEAEMANFNLHTSNDDILNIPEWVTQYDPDAQEPVAFMDLPDDRFFESSDDDEYWYDECYEELMADCEKVTWSERIFNHVLSLECDDNN